MAKKCAVKNPNTKAALETHGVLTVHLEPHNEPRQATTPVAPSTEDRPLRPVIEVSEAAIRNRLEFFATLENNDKLFSAKSNI